MKTVKKENSIGIASGPPPPCSRLTKKMAADAANASKAAPIGRNSGINTTSKRTQHHSSQNQNTDGIRPAL